MVVANTSSLLLYGGNYDRNKFYITGSLSWQKLTSDFENGYQDLCNKTFYGRNKSELFLLSVTATLV